jgi:hypothetical protein
VDYSALYVRSSDQYLFSATEHASLTGDFTVEFWWKPTTLAAGEDQTFWQVNHTLGGSPIRLWRTDDAGAHRLRLRCQEVGGAAPAATEFVEIEWDIDALVSTGTWVHIAVAFDVSEPVATIAELYTDSVSRGNGTVVGGTDCSSILVGDNGQQIGSDGAGDALDGQLFAWRMWEGEVRTPLQISDNYQLILSNVATGNIRQSMYRSGQSHINNAYNLSSVLWTEANGPIDFTADIPSSINQEAGTVSGGVILGDFITYSSLASSAVAASLVELSSGSSLGITYRMRGTDDSLGEPVYWTSSLVDELGDDYTGPGPLSDIVVSGVIS